jgi:5-methylcytosine-specific restriction protein A
MKLATLKPRVDAVAGRTLRTTAIQRIRGRRLQRIRREHFRRNPLCVHCEAKGLVSLAVELDHIVPLHRGGSDSEANRQGLCAECHAAKTRLDLAPW